MGPRCLALYLTVLFSGHGWQIWALSQDDAVVKESMVLNHVLEAEIDATKHQLELHQLKAKRLSDAIKQIQSQRRQNTSTTGDLGSGLAATQQRRQRPRESPQLFSDWFEPQGTFSASSGGANSSRMLTQLISFRPNTSPVGRRQQGTARRKSNIDDEPPLQFLLVLDPHSTLVSLIHPTTFELMWQHALDLRSTSASDAFQVADMFFVSDRSAHLAILSTSGDLSLFKLRLWHNRRIVAGDPRRLKPMRGQEENHLQCPAGQDSLNASDPSQPPWLQQLSPSLTTPSPGKYLHVDVERVFEATLNNHAWHYERGKVAVIAQFYRVVVVASDSSGGHLSFFHGENGSFVKGIHTQVSSNDGNVVRLEPIQNSRGLVALAAQTRVLFVDTTVPHLAPVACEAPGRHTFTSLATDPLRPSILYAGTSTGRALVYKLHNLGTLRQRADTSERESPSPVTCTLVDQLMPQRPHLSALEPAIVQTMPGFLVLGTGSRLVLYQLSGNSDEVHPTYLSERSLVDSFAQGLNGINHSTVQILGVSAAKDLTVHSTGFAVLVANSTALDPSHRLHIYESRIPLPGTNLDLSWIRVPAMMVCALAAMFWQQKGRLAYSAGGRGAFNEAELAGLLSGRGGRLPSMGSMKRGGLNANRRANDWY